MYVIVCYREAHMIEDALQKVQARIEQARLRVGRTDKVTLVAVTKNHPVSAVEEVAQLGITNVGENRVSPINALL